MSPFPYQNISKWVQPWGAYIACQSNEDCTHEPSYYGVDSTIPSTLQIHCAWVCNDTYCTETPVCMCEPRYGQVGIDCHEITPSARQSAICAVIPVLLLLYNITLSILVLKKHFGYFAYCAWGTATKQSSSDTSTKTQASTAKQRKLSDALNVIGLVVLCDSVLLVETIARASIFTYDIPDVLYIFILAERIMNLVLGGMVNYIFVIVVTIWSNLISGTGIQVSGCFQKANNICAALWWTTVISNFAVALSIFAVSLNFELCLSIGYFVSTINLISVVAVHSIIGKVLVKELRARPKLAQQFKKPTDAISASISRGIIISICKIVVDFATQFGVLMVPWDAAKTNVTAYFGDLSTVANALLLHSLIRYIADSTQVRLTRRGSKNGMRQTIRRLSRPFNKQDKEISSASEQTPSQQHVQQEIDVVQTNETEMVHTLERVDSIAAV